MWHQTINIIPCQRSRKAWISTRSSGYQSITTWYLRKAQRSPESWTGSEHPHLIRSRSSRLLRPPVEVEEPINAGERIAGRVAETTMAVDLEEDMLRVGDEKERERGLAGRCVFVRPLYTLPSLTPLSTSLLLFSTNKLSSYPYHCRRFYIYTLIKSINTIHVPRNFYIH